MTYQEQADRICDAFKNETARIHSLPPDEAKQAAQENLIKIGILNEDGTVDRQYRGLFEIS